MTVYWDTLSTLTLQSAAGRDSQGHVSLTAPGIMSSLSPAHIVSHQTGDFFIITELQILFRYQTYILSRLTCISLRANCLKDTKLFNRFNLSNQSANQQWRCQYNI